MKKLLLGIVIMGLMVGLYADNGLMGIWFGDSFAQVKKSLKEQGYDLTKSKQNIRQFDAREDSKLCRVVLFLNKSKNVAGWTVYYQDNLVEKQLVAIYDECIKLHGTEYQSMVEENMVAWKLDEKRSFMLSFDADNHLQKGIYHDESQKELYIPLE